MKKSVIGLLCAVLLILVAFIFQNSFSHKSKIYRYEQHKEALCLADSGDALEGTLITHLPIIKIDTNGQKIPGFAIWNEDMKIVGYEKGENDEEEIMVNISIYDNSEAQNTMNNEPNLAAKALFHIRGNSSRAFSKSSYEFKLVDEKNEPLKLSVMGMVPEEEWVLYAPYLDKTLLRNYMWLNISANIMGYAPNVRFCECYIDGEYKGLFVMMETIDKAVSRVNISDYDKNDRVVPYLLRMDKIHDERKALITFSSYSSHLDYKAGFTVLYPNVKNLNETVKAQIEQEVSNFEKSLYSYDFNDSKRGYENYIDVDSWVDYYVIQEFLANSDMCSKSTYMYKDKGGKLIMGPVWDFNNVCDNYLSAEYGTEGFLFAENKIWYDMLLKDKKFVEKVQKRYRELRKTYLSEEYLMNYIDESVLYLGEAVNRNFEVWGYTFKRENQTSPMEFLQPIERNPQNYEEAINQYKTFLKERGNWLDENIDSLLQYSHPSKNKLYLE